MFLYFTYPFTFSQVIIIIITTKQKYKNTKRQSSGPWLEAIYQMIFVPKNIFYIFFLYRKISFYDAHIQSDQRAFLDIFIQFGRRRVQQMKWKIIIKMCVCVCVCMKSLWIMIIVKKIIKKIYKGMGYIRRCLQRPWIEIAL